MKRFREALTHLADLLPDYYRTVKRAGFDSCLVKRQTDHQVSTLRDTLVGEAAGFLYEDVPGLIPHSTKYEKVRNNYYRLVLVGERTIVAIDVYGTPSSSIEQLQAAAEPVVRALRFEKQ